MPLTITESLAEIKMIGKRLEKKREFIMQYIGRQDGLKDPLGPEGGSRSAIAVARQGIADLENRIVTIRSAIQEANAVTMLTIEGETKSIADWLVWRREVSAGRVAFVQRLRQTIMAARKDAVQKGLSVRFSESEVTSPTDIIVNVDEAALAKEAEQLETILGVLDGQLSLKNATVIIDV
jgi:hypothetical protein